MTLTPRPPRSPTQHAPEALQPQGTTPAVTSGRARGWVRGGRVRRWKRVEGFQLVHYGLAICARHMITSFFYVQPCPMLLSSSHLRPLHRASTAHRHFLARAPRSISDLPALPYHPPQMSVSFSQKLAHIMVCSLRWRLASHAEFPLNLLLSLEQALCIRAVLSAASFLLVLAMCYAAAAAPLLPAVHARSRVCHLLSSGRPYAGCGSRPLAPRRGGRDVTEMMPDAQENAACPTTIVRLQHGGANTVASGTNTFASAVMTNLAGKAGKVLPPPTL